MKKYLIMTVFVGATPGVSMAALNCCGKCPYNQSQSQCTEKCCTGLTHSEESIGNGVIRITDKETKVTCATSPTGTNLVFCSTTFSYKCEAGYYGNPRTSSGTCTKCPSPGTSAEGSTSQSDCYIPAGTTGSDSSGTYKYVSDCHYS